MCINRVISVDIKNCVEVSLTSDTCLKCLDGFNLTNSDQLCVNQIANCSEYQVTSVNTNGKHNYMCVKCIEKHYLEPTKNNGLGECKIGTISNCREYIPNENKCVKCEFGFYITSPTTCEGSNLENISPYCLETDSTQPDTCSKCKEQYILLERVEKCELANKYKNAVTDEKSKCIGWSDENTCTDCKPMFYGKTCEKETG